MTIQLNRFLDFQRKHPVQLSKPTQTDSVSSTSGVAQSKLTSFINAKKKNDARDPQQIRVTNRILSFVAGTLQPLFIVEAEEFKDMIHTIDPKIIIPNRKRLSTDLITEMSREIHGKLVTKLNETDKISVENETTIN